MSVEVFCSYAHKDRRFLDGLRSHLASLEKLGLVQLWADAALNPGAEWEKEIDKHLNEANIILLLLSADFMSSEFCYSIEMKRALERHEQREAIVIPIILRQVAWKSTPIGKLQALPVGEKPVVKWRYRDDAWVSIVNAISLLLETLDIDQVKAPTKSSLRKDKEQCLAEGNAHYIDRDYERALDSYKEALYFDREDPLIYHYIGATLIQLGRIKEAHPAYEKALKLSGYEGLLSRRLLLVGAISVGLASLAIVTNVIHLKDFIHEKPVGQSTPTPTISPTVPPTKPLYVFSKHTNTVDAVIWSPNGTLIASGSRDGTVDIWNFLTNKILSYKGHPNGVLTVAWSPDGKRIASGGIDGTVQIWDAANGELINTYTGHQAAVFSVAWSPDGTRIASAGEDSTVHIWYASNASDIITYKHSDTVLTVAWSPDSKLIASGSRDKTVQIVDAITDKVNIKYLGHSGSINSVAWSPNSKSIVSASLDNTAQIWDATNGYNMVIYKGHRGGVLSVAWSPDGKFIVSGSIDRTAQVWKNTGSTFFVYKGHTNWVYSVAWSPDEKQVVSGSADKTVQIWLP